MLSSGTLICELVRLKCKLCMLVIMPHCSFSSMSHIQSHSEVYVSYLLPCFQLAKYARGRLIFKTDFMVSADMRSTVLRQRTKVPNTPSHDDFIKCFLNVKR
jgi:hypothetical protein